MRGANNSIVNLAQFKEFPFPFNDFNGKPKGGCVNGGGGLFQPVPGDCHVSGAAHCGGLEPGARSRNAACNVP